MQSIIGSHKMWEELIKLAVSNGIWAVLFLGLLVYQLRDSASREVKYQQTIESLTDKLDVVEDIRGDIVDIKDSIDKLDQKQKTYFKKQKQITDGGK